MTNFDLMMEEALAEMNCAFSEWTEACKKLYRCPDSENRLAQANVAHQKFLIASQKCHDLYKRAFLELQAELAVIAAISKNHS